LVNLKNNFNYKKANSINCDGCKILNEILLENKKIEILDLRSIGMKEEGLNNMKESLKKNIYLKEIMFGRDDDILSDNLGCEILNEILLENNSIEILSFYLIFKKI
jgi:hypothetical protein